MARATGRGTRPGPRRGEEPAALAAACPSGRMGGRDTARRWAPGRGEDRPKAARLVSAVAVGLLGSFGGPSTTTGRSSPRFPSAAHRRRGEAGQGGAPCGRSPGRDDLDAEPSTRAAQTATIKRRETGGPQPETQAPGPTQVLRRPLPGPQGPVAIRGRWRTCRNVAQHAVSGQMRGACPQDGGPGSRRSVSSGNVEVSTGRASQHGRSQHGRSRYRPGSRGTGERHDTWGVHRRGAVVSRG
ncbi:hypothetical protein HNR07_003917 [Nocardiopsis metallicus]|uniref:Uncharacterized protein n=1 Tax=Nocardiopsis metallicus TaxID=179819 RepID=A0A840W712_9ACTN|nr:hypothetical protein [Nocardiopsis metallicus]